ncbi:hypothetical protein EBR43_05095 [bacterium]|nr:hypothetical protein [bacterium]
MAMKVDLNHEVPYLGGVSKDGQTVYLDKRFPNTYRQKDGKVVESHKYLIFHEIAEFLLLSQGESYNKAHRRAAQLEKEFLIKGGINVREYYQNIYDHVKTSMKNIDADDIPKDLDLRPYIEDGLSPTLTAMGYPHKVKHPHSATDHFLNEEMKKDIEL